MTETKKKTGCSLASLKSSRIYIKESICTGCGICGEVCPFGLPQLTSSGKFEITQSQLCVECSACKRNCPTKAIVLNEQKGCGCLWDARQRKKNGKSKSSCCQ